MLRRALVCVAPLGASAWWWSTSEDTGSCASVEELPVVAGRDAGAFAAAMASAGGAVLSAANESEVSALLAEALGVAAEDIRESGFPLARVARRENEVAFVAGPGLAVFTNGKWSSKNVDALPATAATLAYAGSATPGPLPAFLEASSFPKFGEVKDDDEASSSSASSSSASRSSACRTVEARATRIRGRLNGDGGAVHAGVALRPCDFEDVDAFVRAGCEASRASSIGDATVQDPPLQIAELSDCEPAHGARAFDGNGTRVTRLEAALALVNYWAAEPQSEAADVWFVPSGLHFVWPHFAAGHTTTTELDERRRVTVTTLSTKPGVFALENFFDPSEAQAVVDRNRQLIKPSEVGLVGRAGDKTRTSSNAWDTVSPVARDLIVRAFDLLKIDHERRLEDGLQVLHYEPSQWYKPHVDYFTASNGGGGGVSADAFSNAVPLERNGTNRFATVFLYLTDTPAPGGETTFPLSTSHATYRGGRLTHPGTEKTPGFIRNEDADWVCNHTSEALRVTPRAATAVLFYSQRGDASLDPYSLHGSCPVQSGDKWAANLWVWNRPRDAIDKAKDTANAQFQTRFVNADPLNAVDLFWRPNGNVDMTRNPPLSELQRLSKLAGGESINMNTFNGHVFVAKPSSNPLTTIGIFTANKKISTITIPAQKGTPVPYPEPPAPPPPPPPQDL